MSRDINMEHDKGFKRSAIDQWPKEAHCREEDVPEHHGVIQIKAVC